ncbi:MAG: heme lyase CcmF/NrfE family subunit [Deltaproteobacteria bacterium]|nr:heme lyase CcmF/NrfE family subunit [Deltaproteobacteria bacterium]
MISPINWIGNLCIYLCLGSSLFGIATAYSSSRSEKEVQLKRARMAVYVNFFAMTTATLAMMFALLTNDFSVSYVANVGARETPRFFAAISLWSSLEGSILLWGWLLSGYATLCIYCYRNDFKQLMPWVIVTLLSLGVFFYLVLAIPANPFQSVYPVPDNGPGPNPLLQNHWLMSLHPPMLYLGYVGMSVPFAFAVASMVTGKLQDTWVDVTRRWTLVAWMFLSIAIILGGWWSYAVLGWGGYWAWDPVENASFMPWLTGTAFLHSIMVQQRRQMLKIWNLVLICTTFLLTLLGTFLTRSGVLDSVHAFTESGIGHYFLVCIGIALIISVGLIVWRAPRFKSEGRLDHPLSRETAFLLGNLLFVCFCFVVLLGTLYPLIVEALQGVKVSVGEPFFNQMTGPLALMILFLMGVGVAIPWKRGDPKKLLKLLVWPSLLMVAVTTLSFVLGIKKGFVLVTIALVTLSFSIMIFEMITVFITSGKLFSAKPKRYGGFVAHIGILLIAIGVVFSKNYQLDNQVSLKQGESFQIGNYKIQLEKLYANQEPQRFEIIARTEIFKNEKPLSLLNPKLNFYANNREPIGSPAVYSTITSDIYLTLMAFEHDKFQATFRVMVNPAVSWIWVGGGFIMIGVLISLLWPKIEEKK